MLPPCPRRPLRERRQSDIIRIRVVEIVRYLNIGAERIFTAFPPFQTAMPGQWAA
jgi:hypothetical protein